MPGAPSRVLAPSGKAPTYQAFETPILAFTKPCKKELASSLFRGCYAPVRTVFL